MPKIKIETISVKELRLNFSYVKEKLAQGYSFILTYRSIPIAKIEPITVKSQTKQTSDIASIVNAINNIPKAQPKPKKRKRAKLDLSKVEPQTPVIKTLKKFNIDKILSNIKSDKK